MLALNSHAENGTLPLAGGLIDRSAIATQLGLPAEVQQTAEVEAAFHKADQLAGHLLPSRTLGLREAQAAARHAAAATVDAHLRLMEANGEWMPVSRGKISRSGICDPLGLSESLRRSPEVEAVFHAADERAGREAGPSSQFDQFAPRLQELLTGADIELRNGRVPLVWAAKALGLKPYQVRNAPALRKQLDGFNRPDLAAVGVPKIPKVRRERAVAWLGLLGTSRIEIARAISLSLKGVSDATQTNSWVAFFDLVQWLDESEEHREALLQWRNGEAALPRTFQEGVSAWRYSLMRRGGITATTQAKLIGDARRVLSTLRRSGWLSEKIELPTVKDARRKSNPRASVAQVSQDPLVVALDEEANRRELEPWSKDRAQFIAALREEISAPVVDVVGAIRDLNRSRLRATRDAAEACFLRGYTKWQEGQRLMGAVTAAPRLPRALSERIGLEPKEALLGEYLAYLAMQNGGLPPKIERNGPPARHAHILLLRHFGGTEEVADRLHASPLTVAAAITLYLVDSGANTQVARTLHTGAVTKSTNAGFWTVAGHKTTANGKAIIDDLPDAEAGIALTTIEAFRRLAKMLSPLRAAASTSNKDSMFLVRLRHAVKEVEGERFLYLFRDVISDHPSLSGLKLSPSMIRTSVLLELALAREGRLENVRQKAQHASENQTDGYTRKYPIRLLYEAAVRRFQENLQALVLVGMPETLNRLGLNGEKVKLLAENAKRSGLGFLCGAPEAGIQHGSVPGAACRQLDRCAECPVRLVIAEPDLVADLILFNKALWQAEPAWSSERPERWEEAWLPHLALTEVVLEHMSRGPLSQVLAKARQIADQRRADGEQLVELW